MTLHDLLAKIERRRAEYASDIVEGRCADHTAYQVAVARIRTLEEVVDMTRAREEKRSDERG